MHVLHRTQHSFSRIKVYYSCPSCIAGNIAALRFVGSRFSHSTSPPSPPLASWLEFPCEVATRRPRGALVGCGVPAALSALRCWLRFDWSASHFEDPLKIFRCTSQGTVSVLLFGMTVDVSRYEIRCLKMAL